MRKILMLVTLLAAATPALAKDIEITGGSQADFQSMAQDLVAAVDYRAVGPAEATGLTGFGIGAVITYVPVDKMAWQNVTGEDFSGLPVAGLQVTKGLPFDIDVGAFYSTVPTTGVKIYGGELRYAILPGSVALPAVTLRGTYSTVSGIDSFDLDSKSVDLSVSKGFALLTPYAGIGYVSGSADPDASTGFSEAKVKGMKANLGARISLGFLEFTPEVGTVDGTATYSARFGMSFGLGV